MIAASIGNFYNSYSFEQRVKKIHELGFTSVEMTMFEIEREGMQKVLDAIKKFGFKITDVHLTLTDFFDTNPELCKRKLLEAVDAAEKFNTNVVTFHSGKFENDMEVGRKNFLSVLKEVIEYADKKGIKLAIENLLRFKDLNYLIAYEKDLDWVFSKLPIGLLYDVNHGTLGNEPIYKIIEKNMDRLFGLHLGDAEFKKDFKKARDVLPYEHLAIGKGQVDFKRICDIVKNKNKVLIIEIITRADFKDLAEFKQKLESYLS